MLSICNLSVGYQRTFVLAALSAEIEPGTFICLLGRNGVGKSTLMRTVAGLQMPLGGDVVLDGERVADLSPAARARRIAVVLTERAFSPGLRVHDVVSLGRQPFTGWRGQLAADDRRIIEEALARTGVRQFRDRYFDDLSDGERQRVMIARAIAQTARLMILDEITAFLDLPGRVEIMALLRRHAHATGCLVLLSSHDLDLSLQLADRVWLAADGDLHSGTADQLIARGAIAAAFDSNDVRFCAERRRFELAGDQRAP